MAQPTPDTQTELERREAALAAREAELARQQAELQAQKADFEQGKKRLLDNGNKDFVNPKEKLYGVLFALIVLFLVLGVTHTSFFGLFGG